MLQESVLLVFSLLSATGGFVVMSGKLRLDSSAKRCALLSVFGSRSIVFVLLSPGRIPSELLVVSAAGGLSVRGVQKSSVTCQLVPLVIS